MKDANGFDGLARQKLAERGFGFDEAHWADMERLLRERKRKPKAWWPWMAAGLLVLGGGAIWLGSDERSGTLSAPKSMAERNMEMPVPVTEAIPVTPSELQRTETTEPTRTETVEHTTPNQRIATGPANKAPAREAHAGGAMPKAANHGSTPAKEPDAATVHPEVNPAIAAAVATGKNEPDRTSPPSEKPIEADLALVLTKVQEAGTITTDPVMEPVTQDPQTITPEGDATVTSSPEAPPPVEPAAPSPATWIAVSAPFEISALGGFFSTTSIYSGTATEDWGATTERENSIDIGVEVARTINEHFSVGLGAHYARYQEHLLADETTRTDQWINTGYALVPHDTLVLMVTGVVTIGATDYYTTELVPMTINVVEQTVDTSWTTTVVRERLSVINTVSYLEVPLFLDAHFATGRWVFGVRGGPTFGFLTGRQGALPSGDDAGYSDLEDHDFSALTLGCSARAYARYRLSSSMAVGFEPAWRRQLGNAFGDDELQRRGEALGAYLSLSYRFGGGVTP